MSGVIFHWRRRGLSGRAYRLAVSVETSDEVRRYAAEGFVAPMQRPPLSVSSDSTGRVLKMSCSEWRR